MRGFINSYSHQEALLFDWIKTERSYLGSNEPVSFPVFPVIRAKVVGKKLLRDGPFGTMRYTVKQMKVRILDPL